MKRWGTALAIGCALAGAAARGADNTTLFVQAARTELRQEPKTSGPIVARVKRGDRVELKNRRELWYEVTAGTARGWIPRLFLSQHPPIGATELLNLPTSDTLEKASRRRPASFSVSASTRGLMIAERSRRGQERFATDYEALSQIEDREIPEERLDNFRAAAKLLD